VEKEKVTSNPAFGNITVGRVQGRVNLFGSDVEHHTFISVAVSRCDLARDLSHDWFHPGEELIEVWMSELQWAQFVSSFNQGGGTPVTLHHVLRKAIPELPSPKPAASTFQKEVTATAKDSLDALKGAVAKLEAVLLPKAKPATKGELREILENLRMAAMHFTNNLSYVEDKFGEAVAHKLTEAKLEFDGYMANRLRSLGLEATAQQLALDEAPKPRFLTGGEPDAEP